jgi:glycyl-tRNA synthetase beta chain
MPELLLEILSEEIPAGLQEKGAGQLLRLIKDGLKDQALKFDDIKGFATPRRLVVAVAGLPSTQPDVHTERKGPGINAPDQAIAGFLKSVGRTRDQVEERETPKGVVLYVSETTPGRPTGQVLADVLVSAIGDVTWAKSMHWAENTFRWVRPLHGILAVFDGKPLDFALDLGDAKISAVETTTGHRFMAPDAITVTGFDDYRDKLKSAYVILDSAERRTLIREGAEALAKDAGLSLRADERLISEIAGLVEWPVPLMGTIDDAFMDLPPEVLATSMAKHQRYLALETGDGDLAPHFIVVANIEASDSGAAIIAGNERVLRARLADAKFFWDQDRKTPLAAYAPRLGDIAFHRKLGSLDQKVDRVQALAVEIAGFIDGAEKDQVRSAARLAKADLVTGMVGEFPNLQGIIGRYYALADGESTAVADAIGDQYSPKGPDDDCPSAPVSVALCLAERIDTLVGSWAIDEKPTGSKDPFALRRAALGVIRLVVENELRLPLAKIFEAASRGLPDTVRGNWTGDVSQSLMTFFADRLKVHLKERGVRHDLISAVLALTAEDDLVRLLARVDALAGFLGSEDGGDLLVAYRRAANIVRIEEKKDSTEYRDQADGALFREAEEGVLSTALDKARTTLTQDIADENFADAMAALARLRPPVDAFFDAVTVNDDDPALRANRLRFLSQITSTLEQVADFSKIEG